MTAISESPRFKSDLRQMGGILFAFSAMALVFPLADYTNLVTGDGSTGGTTLSMVMLIGDICVLGVGLLGMAVGFGLLTDGGSANLTFVACVWEQTVFIEWISKMVNTKNGTCICILYEELTTVYGKFNTHGTSHTTLQ